MKFEWKQVALRAPSDIIGEMHEMWCGDLGFLVASLKEGGWLVAHRKRNWTREQGGLMHDAVSLEDGKRIAEETVMKVMQ